MFELVGLQSAKLGDDVAPLASFDGSYDWNGLTWSLKEKLVFAARGRAMRAALNDDRDGDGNSSTAGRGVGVVKGGLVWRHNSRRSCSDRHGRIVIPEGQAFLEAGTELPFPEIDKSLAPRL